MKLSYTSFLLAAFLSLVASVPVVVPFSGPFNKTTAGATMSTGVMVSAGVGSMCSVEAKVFTQLGVNCTVIFNLMTPQGWPHTVTLTGGVNLMPAANGQMQAQINYRVILQHPQTRELYQIPSAAVGMITVPFPAAAVNTSFPISICLTNITKFMPNSDEAAELALALKLTGSNACIKVAFNNIAAKAAGASISLSALVDLLDAANSVDPQTLTAVLNLLGLAKVTPMMFTLNIGQALKQLLATQNTTAAATRRVRALADATSDFTDANGNFLLGAVATPSTTSGSSGMMASPATIAGTVVGVTLAVAAIAGVGFFVYKKRSTANLNATNKV